MTKEEKIARLIKGIDILIALNEAVLREEVETLPNNVIPFPLPPREHGYVKRPNPRSPSKHDHQPDH